MIKTDTGNDRPVLFRITIFGEPRTKKTSNQLVPLKSKPKCERCGQRRMIVVPSKYWREWIKRAVLTGWHFDTRPIDYPVSVRALFYRTRNAGDSCGFYQGLGDMLQHFHVVKDDRFIRDWDGSRLLKGDPPRVEVEFRAITEGDFT